MSKHNKTNKSNYDQAGRLTPDEMARERDRQRQSSTRTSNELFRGQGDSGAAPAAPRRRDEPEESA